MPKAIYVPDDYAKIQYAVDNAGTGDTIIVRDGTYIENINVDKRLTIKSENGSENCIVRSADPRNSIFMLTANYINLSGFTVEGTTAADTTGIHLRNANHCYITNNIASKNRKGLFLDSSTNNWISSNTANSNDYNGIGLRLSSKNTIEYNNASKAVTIYPTTLAHPIRMLTSIQITRLPGITLWNSRYNSISNNTCL